MGGGTGRLPGRGVCRDEAFAGTGRLPGRDVCLDGVFAGILPCMYIYLRASACLYGGELPGWPSNYEAPYVKKLCGEF